MEMIKFEKKEKNVLSDEKTTYLEDIQLEMNQVSNDLKMSQTNLEKCNNVKEMENKKKQEFEDKIKDLSQENIKMETECKRKTEQLASIEYEKEEVKKQFENEIDVLRKI